MTKKRGGKIALGQENGLALPHQNNSEIH